MPILILVFSLLSIVPQSPLALDRLEGGWAGTGQVRGQAVRAELQFEKVLGGRFTRLTYRFGEELPGPPRTLAAAFEGHAYYAACPAGAGCSGQWFDTLGFVRLISATQTADTLASEWKTAGAEAGKSEYKILADGGLVVTDWVRAGHGSFREFGRVTYSRVR
ncbi:MAG TPA: hypothetical protein VFV98_16435 [Vicinamibacterales bacterium]|nr:hypothetical protein [Vicinamibacterales bacterium]